MPVSERNVTSNMHEGTKVKVFEFERKHLRRPTPTYAITKVLY